MWWVGAALAQEPTIALSREKEDAERTPPYVVTADMNSVKADETYEKEYFRRQAVARLEAMDEAFRWELPAVEACAAATPATGEVVARFTIEGDGTVKKVAPKSGDPALAACVRDVFTNARLPLTVGAHSVTYTLAFGPGPRVSPPPPPIDRDLGVNGVRYGASSDTLEVLERMGGDRGTTFFQRDTDTRIELMGVSISGMNYGFDADGLYVVIVRGTGDDAKFKLRQAIRARYGQGRIDPETGAEYWRGQLHYIEARDVGTDLLVTFLDIARGRATGLVNRLGGDKAEDKAKEVPRYLRKALEQEEAPAPPAP